MAKAVSEDWLLLEALGAWRACETSEDVDEKEKKEQVDALVEPWPPKVHPGLQKSMERSGKSDLQGKYMQEGETSCRDRKRTRSKKDENGTVGHGHGMDAQLRYLQGPPVEPRTKDQAHGDFLLARQRERQGAPAKTTSWRGFALDTEADTKAHLQDCIESSLYLEETNVDRGEAEELQREGVILQASMDTASCFEQALVQVLGIDLQAAQPAIARDDILRTSQPSTAKKPVRSKKTEIVKEETQGRRLPVHACKGKVPSQTLQFLVGDNQSHREQVPSIIDTDNTAWERMESTHTQLLQTSIASPVSLCLSEDQQRLKEACLRAGISEQAFLSAHRRLADLYGNT